MRKKFYKGLVGDHYEQDGAMDAFAEFANEVLPDEISEEAVPKRSWFKRKYADGTIAAEPKLCLTAPNVTHVDSLGSAFINENWEWCGYEMAAGALGISRRKLHYMIGSGDACPPDIYLGKAWFVPDSYFHLVQ